jgi:hypothetical protein
MKKSILAAALLLAAFPLQASAVTLPAGIIVPPSSSFEPTAFDAVIAFKSGGNDTEIVGDNSSQVTVLLCRTAGGAGDGGFAYKTPSKPLVQSDHIQAGLCVLIAGVTFLQANSGSSSWSGLALIRVH